MSPSPGVQQWHHTAPGEPELCEKPRQVPHDGHRTDVEEATSEPAALRRQAPGGQHAPAAAPGPREPLLRRG